jgi:hypothetical protein
MMATVSLPPTRTATAYPAYALPGIAIRTTAFKWSKRETVHKGLDLDPEKGTKKPPERFSSEGFPVYFTNTMSTMLCQGTIISVRSVTDIVTPNWSRCHLPSWRTIVRSWSRGHATYRISTCITQPLASSAAASQYWLLCCHYSCFYRSSVLCC